jgi:hypothetical protein
MKKLPEAIDGYSLPHLLKTAKDVVKRKTQQSVVLDRDAEDRIPKFHELGEWSLWPRQCLILSSFTDRQRGGYAFRLERCMVATKCCGSFFACCDARGGHSNSSSSSSTFHFRGLMSDVPQATCKISGALIYLSFLVRRRR